MKKIYISFILSNLLLIFSLGCKKLIEIPPPDGTITTSQVFTTDAQAIAAITGLYYKTVNTNFGFASYGMTIYAGMSADELIPFDQNPDDFYIQFQQNNLSSNNNIIVNSFWNNPYYLIYASNAILEGLEQSSSVHDSIKNEIIGEAKFMRAFCNFYLVNLYGAIPLATTINWHKTGLLNRTSSDSVYNFIIHDLKDAQSLLASDFSAGKGQRIIPNKWAATGLLSRVYLYRGSWEDASNQATLLINSTGLFNLKDSLDDIFLINSSEAIWQLQQDNSGGYASNYNATMEGWRLIPIDSTAEPVAFLSEDLLNAFDPQDKRKSHWINSTVYNNIKYYYPYKYKMGRAQAAPNGSYTEYDMVLRLAEQYLIRAEAKAKLNDLQSALSDLNIIRNRAGLKPINSSNQSAIIQAILQERRIELFAEWGHRWLDLKRTNLASSVLSTIKTKWTDNSVLYPIPLSELKTDPNLTQNPGY